MSRFLRLLFLAPLLALTPGLSAQPALPPAVELANLREDVRLLTQRLGELALRVEQLEKANAELARTAAGAQQNAATVSQLNAAIADLSRDIRTAQTQTKNEVLAVVATQMENLAKQTNAALDAMARNRAAAAAGTPAAPATFSDNFPKEGVTYTVQRGDTLSSIAQRHGARVQDIINANRITDPARVQVGQVLFIPGAR
jgi:LysM repeat protein